MKEKLNLCAGEWVEVRSKEEILATLNEKGELENLPFMPEMFRFCGQRFQVFKRAHKSCDTVNRTGGVRMHAAVHLGLRCTGDAHGGCQAACMLFWKEAWLKRASGAIPKENRESKTEIVPIAGPSKSHCTEAQVKAATQREPDSSSKEPIFSCQATELPRYTTPLQWWDPRQYIEDFFSGNVGLWRIFCGFVYMGYNRVIDLGVGLGRPLRWFYDSYHYLWGGYPYPRRSGKIQQGDPTPSMELNLQPGESVRVKDFPAVLSTLNSCNKNRGMYFDTEEVPYCGQIFRVKARVNQIIDERTGKMLNFKSGSVILEGAFCQSRYSQKRLFCPRAIYPFWREIWLERVDPSQGELGLDEQNVPNACRGAKSQNLIFE
jgi:hypothetical protein